MIFSWHGKTDNASAKTVAGNKPNIQFFTADDKRLNYAGIASYIILTASQGNSTA